MGGGAAALVSPAGDACASKAGSRKVSIRLLPPSAWGTPM